MCYLCLRIFLKDTLYSLVSLNYTILPRMLLIISSFLMTKLIVMSCLFLCDEDCRKVGCVCVCVCFFTEWLPGSWPGGPWWPARWDGTLVLKSTRHPSSERPGCEQQSRVGLWALREQLRQREHGRVPGCACVEMTQAPSVGVRRQLGRGWGLCCCGMGWWWERVRTGSGREPS